jgi:hypothetical protein
LKRGLPKNFEFILPVEFAYLDIIKNEDKFVKSWEKFKKNHQKSTVTNRVDVKFYDDCEKFTELVIKTRIANKELDQDLRDQILRTEKFRKEDNRK